MRPPAITIDLNADVGEGCAADAALIPLVSSVSIACGGHAGDPATMQATLALAHQHGVACGAHPGFPDRASFGRLPLDLAPAALAATIRAQLATLAALAQAAGVPLHHVKPHGALYNLAAADLALATTLAQTVARFDSRLRLFGLADSALLAAGRAAGLQVVAEAFADRAYNADGTLRDRRLPGAVHTSPATTLAQATALAHGLPITTFDGSPRRIIAQTLCVHGDTPAAVAFAASIRKSLIAAGITLAAP